MPTPDPATHDAYAAFREPGYRNYALGNFISVMGRQMLTVAVLFEIFEWTNSKTALGLVGLVGGLPVLLFALMAGHVADRHNRKHILIFSQAVSTVTSILMVLLSWFHATVSDWTFLAPATRSLAWVAATFGEKTGVAFGPAVPLMLALIFLSSSARTFGWAARGAMVPNLVPRPLLANAITWSASTFQVGAAIGPALGGVLMATFGTTLIYGLDALCALTFICLLVPVRHQQEKPAPREPGMRSLWEGLRFVIRTKLILATITLDLFAVLFGGAVMLLPAFAKDILFVGPIGLGWMQAAPAIGALLMGFLLAHTPLRRAGPALLWSVAGFGLATVIFALSRNYWLSLTMLMLSGALDNISVVVRQTLVQTLTPDSMRGRVSAVNIVFISASNDLGGLESGLAAAAFGTVASAAAGGVITIIVVACCAVAWPEMRRLGRLGEKEEGTGRKEEV